MSLLYYVRTCVLARSFSRVTSVSCSRSISLASYALSLAFIALSRSLRAYSVCVCVGEGGRGNAGVFQLHTYYTSSTQDPTPHTLLALHPMTSQNNL